MCPYILEKTLDDLLYFDILGEECASKMAKYGLTDLFPKQKSESQKDTSVYLECCKPKVQKSNKTLIVTVPM